MEIARLIINIVLIIVSIGLITVVLMQSGKSSGLSGLTGGGGSETFYGKNKSKTHEARYVLLTKVFAAMVVVLSITLVVIQQFA